MRGRVRIGTSGYQYDDWRGVLYPRDLPKRQWLGYYAERFDTVEINNTFYKLPEATTFAHWAAQVPRGFCFSLKLSRYATHMKKLEDPEQPIELFLERSKPLGRTRGPILVQLPPRFRANPARLDAFLRAAPRRLRWAVEVRDPSWLASEVYAVLERHGAALCIHDLIERHPRVVTADFVYQRFHGEDYGGSYSPQALSAEATRIADFARQGLDVYVYFNNDRGGHAVDNAMDLRRYVERRLG